MTKLVLGDGDSGPVVVRVTATDAAHEVDIALPSTLTYFGGHFAGFPILPGIVQLHWAVAAARQLGLIGDQMPGRMQFKFRRPIQPTAILTLKLNVTQLDRDLRLWFDYRCGPEICSSGWIGLRR